MVAETAWLGEHGMASGADAQAVRLSALARQAEKVVVVPDSLWKMFTGLESPARIGFVLARSPAEAPESALRAGVPTVVLDRVQDAGNVGSILRSASAMGVVQVVALKGTAGLWSPKVLRAGMGAHFALHLVEQVLPEALVDLQIPLVATSSHTENLLRDCGDFYLRRADGVFAYQLAVVVDDARMGVTEVVRGADLLSSTARQLYLYRLLGLKAPQFAHCPLLLAPDGRRLSKRDGDQSLENLRAKYTAEEIVGRLAFAYGLQPEPAPRTPESLIPDFSWDKVPKQDICLPEGLF